MDASVSSSGLSKPNKAYADAIPGLCEVSQKISDCTGNLKHGSSRERELVELPSLPQLATQVNSDMARAGEDYGRSSWVIYVRDNLRGNEGAAGTDSSACIFGIAHPLLMLKPEAYIPQVISLGPYHHRKLRQYEETDDYKLKMAQTLERTRPGLLNELAEQIKSLDGPIRASYHRRISNNQETLSWMLALDTHFILQFLESIYQPYRNNPHNVDLHERRPILLESIRNTPLWYAIRKDILMLENQVPMLVLVEASRLTNTYGRLGSQNDSEILQGDGRSHEGDNLAAMLQDACVHFDPFVRPEEYRPPQLDLNRRNHVLDCLYYRLVEPEQQTTSNREDRRRPPRIPNPGFFIQKAVKRFIKWMLSATAAGNFPSATVLSDAGIKFAPYQSGDLSEISFKSTISTFFLPKITINDSTEAVLRNLVAFELNLQTEEKPLTRYTYLMDRLVDTERDVAILKKRGILDSHMGSDAEVAQMWNSMSKTTWENKYEPVDRAIEDANKYYRNKWRVMLAQFLRTHFSKPWLVISVLSAWLLLSLTAVQVFCLFYTCNKPSTKE